MKKTILFVLICTIYFLSAMTCFATTTGKTTCPKTVKAGEYFDISLEPPKDFSLPYDDEYEVATNTFVYQCDKCKKWFYPEELIDAHSGENGQFYLICPECPEFDVNYSYRGVKLQNGRMAINMHDATLGYGSASRGGWGCTFKITQEYMDSIPLEYDECVDGDCISIRKPGIYYLTAAYGLDEECDIILLTIDPVTRQLVETGQLSYKKVKYIHYTHDTITVLGKVKFNANGGKVKKGSKWIKQKTKVGALPKPIKKGYKFNGWFTKKKGGKKINKNTKVTFSKSSITYYAHWKKQ